ncbi:unnamed protein product [Owenia fusiformis]|uniref:Ankyrin repeat protein n=1 Tax=Owenia fusiformis TaxID=6347 RepID=A0A8S4Q497_OWEFU|nr:unnamed protein product [Owenia fusiformis]
MDISKSLVDINSQLHSALYFKNAEKLVELLNNGADPNYVHEDVAIFLHAVFCAYHFVSLADYECVKILLNFGADPNVINPGGMTPLKAAIALNDPNMVEILLQNGANVSHPKTSISEFLAKLPAWSELHYGKVVILWDSDNTYNENDFFKSPIHIAIDNRVRHFKETDVNAKYGEMYLKDNAKIVEILARHGAKLAVNGSTHNSDLKYAGIGLTSCAYVQLTAAASSSNPIGEELESIDRSATALFERDIEFYIQLLRIGVIPYPYKGILKLYVQYKTGKLTKTLSDITLKILESLVPPYVTLIEKNYQLISKAEKIKFELINQTVPSLGNIARMNIRRCLIETERKVNIMNLEERIKELEVPNELKYYLWYYDLLAFLE